jgi:hypothetical protein
VANDLARWQFATTSVYHSLFVPVTIGVALVGARSIGPPTRGWVARVCLRCGGRRRLQHDSPSSQELYPEVVDECEEEGGVPSWLMKTDAGDGRQEGTPCRMS